ncbi:hypothetical protein FRC20_005831 [Serendipita sp. 405]|nr:hypothetical protein FRC16_007724 [Serendipita sp. 398]KAG8767233.1 hypothetical protein FRC15_005814 [Serendipita sp. 397]KAG8840025.1 hypothetical protein FRC20_005831 [Serendipita sp. 405]
MSTDELRDSEEFPQGYGDFRLISSDNVVFHFPPWFLSHMSPVFKDMLAMASNDEQRNSELRLTEDADTLDRFLRFCDPLKRILPLDMERVQPLLEAARKYQIPKIFEWMEERILMDMGKVNSPLMKIQEPMTILALATRFDLENLAKVALRELIKAPSKDFQTTVAFESHMFMHLFHLRQQRIKQMVDRVSNFHDLIKPAYTSCGQYQIHQELDYKIKRLIVALTDEPSWATLKQNANLWPQGCPTCPTFLSSSLLFQNWKVEILQEEMKMPELPPL